MAKTKAEKIRFGRFGHYFGSIGPKEMNQGPLFRPKTRILGQNPVLGPGAPKPGIFTSRVVLAPFGGGSAHFPGVSGRFWVKSGKSGFFRNFQ